MALVGNWTNKFLNWSKFPIDPKVTFLHGYFSRFLYITNGAKSRKFG